MTGEQANFHVSPGLFRKFAVRCDLGILDEAWWSWGFGVEFCREIGGEFVLVWVLVSAGFLVLFLSFC